MLVWAFTSIAEFCTEMLRMPLEKFCVGVGEGSLGKHRALGGIICCACRLWPLMEGNTLIWWHLF